MRTWQRHSSQWLGAPSLSTLGASASVPYHIPSVDTPAPCPCSTGLPLYPNTCRAWTLLSCACPRSSVPPLYCYPSRAWTHAYPDAHAPVSTLDPSASVLNLMPSVDDSHAAWLLLGRAVDARRHLQQQPAAHPRAAQKPAARLVVARQPADRCASTLVHARPIYLCTQPDAERRHLYPRLCMSRSTD